MSVSTFSQMSPSKLSPSFTSQAQSNNKEKIGGVVYNFDDNEHSPVPSQSTTNGKAFEPTKGFKSNEATLKSDKKSQDADKPQKLAPESINDKSINLNQSTERQPVEVRTFTSIGSANKTKDKEIQMQLEVSQSRLHGLAKRIDECLSASKVNYSESKVMQPSIPSVSSQKSLNESQDTKDVKPAKETQEVPKPEVVSSAKVVEKQEAPEVITRSNMMSRESTAEEKLSLIDQLEKKKPTVNKNKVESKPEPKPKSKPQPQPKETPKPQSKSKEPPKQPVKETPKPKVVVNPPIAKDNRKNKASVNPSSMDIQKQLDTVSSVSIETTEEALRQKDFQGYNLGNSSSFAPSSMFKESTISQPKTKTTEKPSNLSGQGQSSANKPVVNQVKSPIKDNRFSFSNAVETGSSSAKKTNASENVSIANKTAPTKVDKSKAQKSDRKGARKKSEAESGHLSKRTLNISNYEFEKDHHHNDDRDLEDLIDQSEMSHPPMPQKLEPLNATISRHSSKPENQHLSGEFMPNKSNATSDFSRKKVDLKLDAYLEEKFEMNHNISPVLNDRRSSRGRDMFTPAGYNFDGTNMSMNELKNLSFDSSLLGKEPLSTKGNETKIRERSGFSHRTMDMKSQDDLKSNKSRSRAFSHGKKESSIHGEDLESSFTKAYTFRKNKLIQDVDKFDDRMQSDIYFRRRFRNDLNKFLQEYKPKITEEEAEMLYHRLAEDAKKREVKALKIQLQSERSYKVPVDSHTSIPEDQLNQTFERLVADARKRLFVQEEKEKLKILKEEEAEKIQIKANSRNKISKEAEEKLVDRFTAEAQRRRLKHEKQQRAKLEEEIRQANDLQSQGFKSKNNHARSKVKDYIETKQEKRSEKSVERAKMSKSLRSFYSERKARNDELFGEEEEDAFSKLLDKNQNTNYKFSSPKTRYLSIASPTNKIESTINTKNMGKAKSPARGDNVSSLQYLKHLREDINKYRSDIEGHIQSINNIDIVSPSQLKDKNTTQSRSEIKKLSLSGIQSPKNDQSALPKVSNKYKNVESKVAKQIEGKLSPQPKANPSSDTKKKEMKETPSSKKSLQGGEKSGSKSIRTPGRETKTTERLKTENEDSEKKGKSQNNKFMNAQDAIHFVEKLISDFKTSNKI